MVRSATFSGFVLRPGSPDLETEFVRLKLFGSDQPDAERDRYSESSFVLALANRLAVWHEKDTEYRHALLGALTE